MASIWTTSASAAAARFWSSALPLFAARDGAGLMTNAVRMLMERRFREAGIAFHGTHGLWRSWTMAYLDAGGDPLNVKELAGWPSLSMLHRYAKRTAQEPALRNIDQFSPTARLTNQGRSR